jgi:hypothetical protein
MSAQVIKKVAIGLLALGAVLVIGAAASAGDGIRRRPVRGKLEGRARVLTTFQAGYIYFKMFV